MGAEIGRRSAIGVTWLLVSGGIAVGGVATNGAAAPPARVFDRTLVCTTGDGGPSVSGVPSRRGYPIPGSIMLVRMYTGGSAPLVWVSVRDGALVDKQHCTRTTNKVPLTRKGLPGPPMGVGTVRCPLGRVLVRVRYTYVPGAHPAVTEVGGRFISAALAVRSFRTLKPLAFATLRAKGLTAQLYSATSCTIV